MAEFDPNISLEDSRLILYTLPVDITFNRPDIIPEAILTDAIKNQTGIDVVFADPSEAKRLFWGCVNIIKTKAQKTGCTFRMGDVRRRTCRIGVPVEGTDRFKTREHFILIGQVPEEAAGKIPDHWLSPEPTPDVA